MYFYCIYDSKADTYSQPIVAENDVSAKRIFLSFCVSNQFYADFKLFRVGEFYQSLDAYKKYYPEIPDEFFFRPVAGMSPIEVVVSDDEISKAISDYRKYQKGVYNA